MVRRLPLGSAPRVIAAAVALWAVGCAGGKPEATGNQIDCQAALEEFGQMLQLFAQNGQRPPNTPAELEKTGAAAPVGTAAVIRGEVVYVWGTGLKSAPDAAGTVLAYEKAADTSGGWVLTQGGQVKRMTADEFRSAPKAK